MMSCVVRAFGCRVAPHAFARICLAGTVFAADKPQPVATCPPDLLRCWGTAKTLTLDNDGETKHYKRLDAAPDAFRSEPLKVAERKPVMPDRLKAIQAELLQRLAKDQGVRQPGETDVEMRGVDVANTAYLKQLVAELGWIDVERVGAHASLAAFVIVQHSDGIPLMKAAFPFIEKDVKAKHLDGQLYATLYDRPQLMTGGKQRFGTQVVPSLAASLEDEKNVDEFRAELGMPPLQEYLQSFGREKAGGAVKAEE